MKIGLIPANVGVATAEPMVGVAKKAEEIGIESVWTFEHVIVPVDYESKYPYATNGKMGATPETPFVDPLIALATIAAHTTKLRLGTGINILSQTNPLLLAKQAASLDALSGGRLMLGLGIGWLREEFVAMGTPFERRGARFDDAVEAMKKVWSGEVVEHESDFLHWHGFKSHPVPAQSPHVPIIIGGTKGRIYERIARHGDGWFIPYADTDELPRMLEQLGAACAAIGRDPSEVEVTALWMKPKDGPDAVRRFEELGVKRLIVPLFAFAAPNLIEGLERFGDELIAKI